MPRRPTSELLAAAQARLAASQYVEAELICRGVLRRRPHDPEAHRLLGLVAYCTGNWTVAESLLQRAVKLDPNSAYAYDNLSVVRMAMGQVEQAEAVSRRALAIRPDEPNFWCNLGVPLEAQSRLAEAEEAYRHALTLRPELFEALRNLGRVLEQSGRLAEAVDVNRKAVMINHDSPTAQLGLAAVLAKLGRIDDAKRCYQQALDIDRECVEASLGLAQTYLALAQPKGAETVLRQALKRDAEEPELSFGLGRALDALGRPEEAEDCYRQALGPVAESADVLAALTQCLQTQGRVAEARETCRQALALRPESAAIHSQLLQLEQFAADVTAAGLAAAHAQWQLQHGNSPAAVGPCRRDRGEPGGRLRLGFVSAEFTEHPLGRLFARLAEHLDRRQCELICYSNCLVPDALSARIRKAVDDWHDVAALSDETLAGQIRERQIDILVDLSGHAPGNCLPLFAGKPAPVQITWLGYPGTTGLTSMDYLLGDRAHVPPADEQYYAEHVLRLPCDYLCYEPSPEAPPLDSPPALAKGFVTFGSFNQLAKISPQCLAAWAEILARVPNSRLLLKAAGADGPRARQRFSQAFSAAGIDPGRIDFAGSSRHDAFLKQMQQVDVALDCFPCGGNLTTCDALWMGLPVVTLPGETFAGRHGLCHLTAVGFTETIARDRQEYVEMAVAWANDLGRLVRVREELRGRMAASPLCDIERFAGDFLRLLCGVWRGSRHDPGNPPPPVATLT